MSDIITHTLDGYAIATCSYSAYQPEMGTPVRTSIGGPRMFKHRPGPGVKLPYVRALAPWGLFGNAEFMGQPEKFRTAYLEGLDAHAGEIAEALKVIAQEFGLPPVLLCFENLAKPDATCHRTYAAEWLESHTSLSVPELGPHPHRHD